jgi:hypothetical protein
VIFRHNEIRDELVNLAGNAFTPSAVRDEPLIKEPSRVKENEKDTPAKDTSSSSLQEIKRNRRLLARTNAVTF